VRIIIFGPTGGTGRELVSQALDAGHEVTAFARDPAMLELRQGLTVVKANPLDAAAVERAIAHHDAVLSALGGRPWRSLPICSRAMGNISAAMTHHKVRRIVAISTFGAAQTRAHVGWVARHLLFGLVLRGQVADKEAMEKELSATDLEWVVVRVGLLSNDSPRHQWRAADDGSIRGMGKIARADVAAFMLAQLSRDDWLRRCPVVMY
jgi:putative NADH-flavin reductase